MCLLSNETANLPLTKSFLLATFSDDHKLTLSCFPGLEKREKVKLCYFLLDDCGTNIYNNIWFEVVGKHNLRFIRSLLRHELVPNKLH